MLHFSIDASTAGQNDVMQRGLHCDEDEEPERLHVDVSLRGIFIFTSHEVVNGLL